MDISKVERVKKKRTRVTVDVYKKALYWLQNGDTGVSSQTLLFTALNIKQSPKRQPGALWYNTPQDIPDLRRCIKLLDEIPEIRDLMYRTAKVSKEWAALVANWSWLESTMKAELSNPANNCKAKKTFEILCKLIGRNR